MPLTIFKRYEWGAERPKRRDLVKKPVKRVVFTYDSHSLSCHSKEDCFKILRKLQKNHFKRNMSDIAWNFLIGGDGNIYEGRGWGVLPSSFLQLDYGDRVDIAYIGKHEDWNVPLHMFKTATELIFIGSTKQYIERRWVVDEIKVPKMKANPKSCYEYPRDKVPNKSFVFA